MNKVLGEKILFDSAGLDFMRKVLLSTTEKTQDVLAVLKFENYSIELTDRGVCKDNKKGLYRDFDYYCCRRLDEDERPVKDIEWTSFGLVEFGDKMPYEFEIGEELEDDMETQLKHFLVSQGVDIGE